MASCLYGNIGRRMSNWEMLPEAGRAGTANLAKHSTSENKSVGN